MTTIPQLMALAKAATAGPWFATYEPYGDQDTGIEGYEPSGVFVTGSPSSNDIVNFATEANAAFIAACSPEFILSLCQRVEKMEECLEYLNRGGGLGFQKHDMIRAALKPVPPGEQS